VQYFWNLETKNANSPALLWSLLFTPVLRQNLQASDQVYTGEFKIFPFCLLFGFRAKDK
jgi:hypothetical protein